MLVRKGSTRGELFPALIGNDSGCDQASSAYSFSKCSCFYGVTLSIGALMAGCLFIAGRKMNRMQE
jgi:hypothetical protein